MTRCLRKKKKNTIRNWTKWSSRWRGSHAIHMRGRTQYLCHIAGCVFCEWNRNGLGYWIPSILGFSAQQKVLTDAHFPCKVGRINSSPLPERPRTLWCSHHFFLRPLNRMCRLHGLLKNTWSPNPGVTLNCDDISGKHHGAKPDKEVNSHILGSDVLMISIGDEMDYHLIRPNYAAGQNYKFTQEHTYKNFTSTNSCKKRIEKLKGLTKTVPLSNGTLYIHTAHNDEIFYHCLDFAKQTIKTNRVRLVLVFRWLSASTYFRQIPQDERANCYYTVDSTLLRICILGRRAMFGGMPWDIFDQMGLMWSHR